MQVEPNPAPFGSSKKGHQYFLEIFIWEKNTKISFFSNRQENNDKHYAPSSEFCLQL